MTLRTSSGPFPQLDACQLAGGVSGGGGHQRLPPAAAAELRSAGVEVVFESELDQSGNAWVHFCAPDGNLYEFTQDPGVARPP